MAKRKKEENKPIGTWKVTISTDRFTDRIIQELDRRIKQEPGLMFVVKGPARVDFEKWLKDNYPEAKYNGEYYTIGDFCPPDKGSATATSNADMIDEVEIEDV